MTYEVISAFRDRRTGEQIDPGQPLPEGLDRDTIARLIQAQCLRPVEDEPAPSGGQAAGEGDGGASLFPETGDAGSAGDTTTPAIPSQPNGGRRGRRTADTGNTQ